MKFFVGKSDVLRGPGGKMKKIRDVIHGELPGSWRSFTHYTILSEKPPNG